MHYEDKKTGFKFDAVSGVPKENTVEAFEELFATEKEAEKGELPEPPRPQHMRSLGYDGSQMRGYAREAIAADRASRQVANKAEVETIDTPEFRELLAAFKNSSLGFDYNETVKNLVAHINGRFATPLATTGASTVLTDERIGRVVLPAGFVLMPEKPSYLIIAAMASSQAEDEDGPFVPMLDLLDFSGENKAHTALKAAYCAAVVASSLEKKSA